MTFSSLRFGWFGILIIWTENMYFGPKISNGMNTILQHFKIENLSIAHLKNEWVFWCVLNRKVFASCLWWDWDYCVICYSSSSTLVLTLFHQLMFAWLLWWTPVLTATKWRIGSECQPYLTMWCPHCYCLGDSTSLVTLRIVWCWRNVVVGLSCYYSTLVVKSCQPYFIELVAVLQGRFSVKLPGSCWSLGFGLWV